MRTWDEQIRVERLRDYVIGVGSKWFVGHQRYGTQGRYPSLDFSGHKTLRTSGSAPS